MDACTAFFLRFLLPPFYAALGFTLFTVLFEATTLRDAPVLLGGFALFAYIVAGVPALLFATVMRHVEKRKKVRSCVPIAALLGGLSGAAIGALTRSLVGVVVFVAVGYLVGGLVEATVIMVRRRMRHGF